MQIYQNQIMELQNETLLEPSQEKIKHNFLFIVFIDSIQKEKDNLISSAVNASF